MEELNAERANISKSKDQKDHKELWKKKMVKLKAEIDESGKEVANIKRHLAECEVNIEQSKKDLIKSKDRMEKEARIIEDLKAKLTSNEQDLVQKKKDLVVLKVSQSTNFFMKEASKFSL